MASEPRLDVNDIQGNIIPGFRRRHELLVGYSGGTETQLRAALAVLAPRLTPVRPVLLHRDQRKAALVRTTAEPDLPDLWVSLALGAQALDRLGEAGVRGLDKAFDVGMRPARTGDPWSPADATGAPNPAHPANWVVGSTSRPLDLLLILAFDDWVAAGGDALLAAVAVTGLAETWREAGERLPSDIEHFGFVDGISEVGVRGEVDVGGQLRPITTRYGVPSRNGVDYGRPGQAMAWPGQFLVGTATSATAVDAAPARYRNGSFLVFRRLRQDVAAFYADTDALAAETMVAPERLRADVVGRWPSGAALMRHAAEPPQPDDVLAVNYFGFASAAPDLALPGGAVAGAPPDPAPIRGLRCPAFAHVRKVNPRDLPTDLGGPPLTQGFQMLRRGVPFGPLYDHADPAAPSNADARGLLFLAYQRAPSRQFEKLNTNWMNMTTGPGPGGHDLLVGQRVSPTTGQYEPKEAVLYGEPEPAPGQPIKVETTWVVPTGGAYLFAPSLSHATAMAAGPLAAGAGDGTQLAETFALKLDLDLEALGLEATQEQSVVGPNSHDGATTFRRRPGRRSVTAVVWPETALLPSVAGSLNGAAIRDLDLSGFHFPTETISSAEAAELAGELHLGALALHGVTLGGADISTLLRSLPHLLRLNLAGLDIDDVDVASVVEARPQLIELSLGLAAPREGHAFCSTRLTEAILQSLDGLKVLRSLSLRGVSMSEDAIHSAEIWDRLVSLDLSMSPVSDSAVEHIVGRSSLQDAAFERTAIGDRAALALLARPLATLVLSRTGVTQDALLASSVPGPLKMLGLAGLGVDDHLAPWLGAAAHLEEIDLSDTSVGDSVAATLGTLPRLRSVKLNRTVVTDEGLAALLRAPVADLEIEGIETSERGRRALADSASLTRVALNTGRAWSELDAIRAGIELKAPAPPQATAPRGLQSLDTDRLSKELAHSLSSIPGLHRLSIRSADAGLRLDAGGFGELEEIFAEDSGLDDPTLASILALPAIGALYVSDNPFGPALGGTLSPSINTLELRGTLVSDNEIASIAALPRLHCIDVPNTRVTPAGVKQLVEGAANLQSLALDGSQVTGATVAAMEAAPRLFELYLYGSDVTTATIAALAPMRLRELHLIGTTIGDDAVPHLAAIAGLRVLTLGAELGGGALEALRALRPFLDVEADDVRLLRPRAGRTF